MTRIAVHLGGCVACHAQYNELAGRAARVAALMESLEVGPVTARFVPAPRRWTKPLPKPVVAAVLALAATAALAFVLLPKRAAAPKPVATPHFVPVRPAMVQAAAPDVERTEPSAPRAKARKRPKSAGSAVLPGAGRRANRYRSSDARGARWYGRAGGRDFRCRGAPARHSDSQVNLRRIE